MNEVARPTGPLMVVDDDRLVLLTVSHGLRQAGFEVVEADNGDDAILMARRCRPRLALLDIRMQGLSGFDVAQYLRDYSHTRFMFLSAFTDEATRAQAARLGALACLDKPVQMPLLVQRIEQALALEPDPWPADPHLTDLAGRPVSDPQSRGPTWPSAAVAVGLLMHRHGLTRVGAGRRLEELAAAHGRSIEQAADDLLRAQEMLAASGPLGA